MNKSLILVMCDVLVLSAMSLSDGGFSSENSLGAGVRDVTAEHASVVADLEKTRNAQRIAEEERRDALAAAAAAQTAKAAAEDARKKAETEAARDKLAAEAARKGERIAKDEAEKSRDAQKIAEGEMRNALAAAVAAQTAKVAAEDARKKAETEAARDKLAAEAARKDEQVAKDEAEKARNAQRIAEEGKIQADAAALASRKERDEVDQRYGVPARARQERIERIHKSACAVSVTFSDDEIEEFYSPVIDIDGCAYIVGRYNGKELKRVEKIDVRDPTTGKMSYSHTAYYLRGSPDVAFFKLQDSLFGRRLTIGENSDETLRYWISRKDGSVKRAVIMLPGLRRAASDYAAIEPGDLLVDSGTASLVCVALSRGVVFDLLHAKGAFLFDRKITNGDLLLWHSF